AIVGGLGAGASTPAIVGPFAFVMAATAGVNPVLTAVAITFGNLVGSNNPYNGYGGSISKNLIIANGVDEALTMDWSLKIWFNCCIITIIVIVLFYFALKGHKADKVSLNQKPPEFDPIQKKTVVILLVAFFLMVVPPILNTWIKGVAFLSTLNQICQPQVIMMLGALLCAVLKLGDEKTVIRKIPISTIVMIVGVYSLIQVAAAAGLVEFISGVLSSSIPRFLVPAAIVLFAAFLSFFSSSTSTVMPLMYPMVPALAASLSLNPIMLYTCIFFGGLATSCSPFSTGGAVCIAANPYEDQKELLSNKMIIAALVVPVITIIVATVGLFGLFPA
ncbi:MAG: SLC13 family permease, partial [Muribaculaceae bacterium]|nr:SLC13 family permease [Muribaculaceae bacterium]